MLTLAASYYWGAVVLYVFSAAWYLAGWWRRQEGLITRATWLTAGTFLVPHTAAIVLRWLAVGHGPYINRHEVFVSDVWVGLAVFLAFQFRFPRLRVAGAAIVPLGALLLVVGALSTADVEPLPPSLRSLWLVVHVGFAKLAFGSILLAFGLSVVYLLKAWAQGRGAGSPWYERLPGLARLDELGYRFTGIGFASLAIMILSGSVWAQEAWGNYWSWDAIETWSLATWLLYGTNLHLRATYRWQGRRAAWLTVATLVVTLVAFKGLAYIVPGAHVGYLAK
ncbi:MAG: cytochrome c biogenesis protein CcsA [Chloroflexi bacterium]|nr:cytochrome c biogenesis protein CcsA [Chloroflexota bacterium]